MPPRDNTSFHDFLSHLETQANDHPYTMGHTICPYSSKMTSNIWLISYLGWKLWKRSSRRAWFSRISFSKWNNKTSTIGWKNKRNKQWTKRNIRRKCRKNRRCKFKISQKIAFTKLEILKFLQLTNFRCFWLSTLVQYYLCNVVLHFWKLEQYEPKMLQIFLSKIF